MKVLVCPIGSAGDVHPFVGIGVTLAKRGHDVTVVTSGYFRDLVIRSGLQFEEIGTADEFLKLAGDPNIWHPIRGMSYIFKHGILPTMPRQYDGIRNLYSPGETILIASCLGFGARTAHESFNLPLVTVHLQPQVLWSSRRSPKMALPAMLGDWVPSWFKQLQFNIGERILINSQLLAATNQFRDCHRLPPIQRATSYFYSPQCNIGLFPDWYGPPQPDWPSPTWVTGFPLWDESSICEVSDELESFLNEGEPPIVFTPGSAMMHGKQFFKTAVAACMRMGARGLLLSRFSNQIPEDLPCAIRHFKYLPFSQVLHRSAALVHHGGIGTVSQALAAGIPQLIMPMSHDQPDNAHRIKRLGVGDKISRRSFQAPKVSRTLNTLLYSASVREKCQAIARRMQGDDALEATCNIIDAVGTRCTNLS